MKKIFFPIGLWIALFLSSCSSDTLPLELVGHTSQAVYTGPNLKLPLPSGYRWRVNTEAGTGKTLTTYIDQFHVKRYSIDFGRTLLGYDGKQISYGSGDIDVLAADDGLLTSVVDSCTEGESDCESGVSTKGRIACKIVIDHNGGDGKGYVTSYLHFAEGKLAFTQADGLKKNIKIKRGQYLGKMGNTGDSCGSAHLHFEVFYNDGTLNSIETNTGLDGLTLEGIGFMDHTDSGFKAGQFRYSTNSFTFTPALDNPHTCSNEPSGGNENNGYVNSCTRVTSVTKGQMVWGNLTITNVTHDYCQRGDLYINGVLKATGETWCSGDGQYTVANAYNHTWNRAQVWPSFQVNEKGSGEIRFFITTSASTRAEKPEDKFLPAPIAVAKFTITDSGTTPPPVTPPPAPTPTSTTPYTYDTNAYACSGPFTDPADPLWVPSCANRTTSFTTGQTAYVVAHLNQITVKHRYRMDVYKDEVFQWGWDNPDFWNNVKPGETWGYTYVWATVRSLTPGKWRVKFSVILEGKPNDSAIIPDYYFTVTNPAGTASHTYNGNHTTCAGPIMGGETTNYIYTCQNPKDNFTFGEAPTVMLYVENVTQDFQFYGEATRNDGPGSWTYRTAVYNVGSGWPRAYFWLTGFNAPVGSWTYKLYIEPVGGTRTLLNTTNFTITALPTNNLLYDYNGNGILCKDEPTGSIQTNWVYTCQNKVTSILAGQKIYALVYVTNVKQSHYFRVEAFRDNSYQWSWPSNYSTVNTAQPWLYSHFWPSLSNATFGAWRFDIYIHFQDGTDKKLRSIDFIVF